MTENRLLNPTVFNYICRACLGTQNLLPMGSIMWENVSLKKVLKEFLDVEEEGKEKKMPQSICRLCSKQLYNFWFYLIKVKNNNKLLTKSLDYKITNTISALKSGTLEIKIDIPETMKEDSCDDFSNDLDNDFGDSNSDNDDKIEPTCNLDIKGVKDEKTKELISEIEAVKLDIKEIRKKNVENKKLKQLSASAQEDQPHSTTDDKNLPKLDGSFAPYRCVTCDSGFHNNDDLTAHKNEEKHKGSVFVCPYCKKKTINHPRFKIHLRTHTKEKPNKCPQCGKGFNDKGDVDRHVRHVHIGLKKFKCSICNMRFKRKHYLTDHQRKHTNTKLVCHYCGESFDSVYALYRHERVHKQHEAKNNGTLPKKRSYPRVPKKPNGNNEKESIQKDKFRCKICDKVLYSEITLKDHVLLHGPKDFNCEICGKCFTTAKRLKMHTSVSHEEGKYPCEHCDKVYKQKYVLAQHIEKEHLGSTPSFKCEYCEKDFVYKSSLRQHLRIHTGNTKYQCKVCFKICISQRNLDIHMRNHTGEKPYSCSYCDRRFACVSNMRNHVKTHTGERKNLCAFCPKGFYTNNALKKHMKTHEKEKNGCEEPENKNRQMGQRAGPPEIGQNSMQVAKPGGKYPFLKYF